MAQLFNSMEVGPTYEIIYTYTKFEPQLYYYPCDLGASNAYLIVGGMSERRSYYGYYCAVDKLPRG